ncbi:NAD-dependent epimerase/dehydratase family protein [Daejeonella sp.]|uniref:NAD-dependent epimerase/dehydratase family protein n=1 Tax=Daejeonella sp. TaxID=2805397 RepID=UPI00271DC81F|nr:NAD-dependent epimerase/dehydratase family protein [Daejeonella sp.]MDO8994972.1 NAD-dependent epimerase/dehydratase family protein [Daejeonella sp.]MDP2415637.1 NAD-dependent epimerase/dehydratase family protein [Daejeonella sp.]
MKKLRVITTGATGMVGEGVLLHCLQSDKVSEVLIINRKPSGIPHPKLSELLLSDFNKLADHSDRLTGFDACFYCAGVSSLGKNETDYTRITYDTTLNFAKGLFEVNPGMVFNFVSGTLTKSDGKQMWQRVKGRTEDALIALGFKGQYNFRPGFMKPVNDQKNVRWFFKPFIAIFPYLLPKQSLTLHEVGQAMIHTVTRGYSKQVLEIGDIKILAK